MAHNKHIRNSSAQISGKKSALKNVFGSVAAAFFGVQSNKNRQRDFSEGKFIHFAVAGAIAVVIFIAALIGVVNMVLPG